jgi:NitT/TauT family transport system substrate-binding protein
MDRMTNMRFMRPLGSGFAMIAVILTAVVHLPTASAQIKITIGYAAVSPRTTPLYVAQEQGLFGKYGLDAKVVLFRGAPTLVASLVSGEMEVGYTGGTSVVGAAGQGTYLRILSSISSTLSHTMMAHPSIKRTEELRGKRFGIQNMGSSTWMHTMLALEYVGLEPKRDNINILSIGDSVLIGQALEAGRVDAAVLDGALVRRLRSKGFSTIA